MSLTFLYDPSARLDEVLAEASLADQPSLEIEARLPLLVGVRKRPTRVFRRARVAVAGTGSVGRRIAVHLSRLAVDTIVLVDPGRYDDPANLLTQDIAAGDINGQFKVSATGRACKGISPQTRVLTFNGRLQELDPVLLADTHFLFLATDNLAAEVHAAQVTRYLSIPLIQGSVHGDTLVSQIRFVANSDGCGACLACGFGAEEWSHVQRKTVFSCDGSRTHARTDDTPEPTRSLGFLCSLCADLAMTQWTRAVVGLGKPVGDTLLQYCGFTHRVTVSPLRRNRLCQIEHVAFRRLQATQPIRRSTLRQLSELANLEATSPDTSFLLSDLTYVQKAVCCDDSHPADRFVRLGERTGTCPTCGSGLVPEPYYSHRPVSAAIVAGKLDVPLADLGVGQATWAIVRGPGHGVLIR